ncbi:MAG TPA: enoyl-CoA hydratase/isomerase family protein [Thermohalobaculum sp.]|nr:enoyl-CoA hydratase/isomerase family protein [Thermohalobaculum sp.]
MGEGDILFERRDRLGLITLNRPKAMNALTHEMVLALEDQLDGWAADDNVKSVAIRGAGERAFCAGGDIRALWEAGRENAANAYPFYADEYRMNTRIKRYPKPYVAIMDGVTMGGGVGVSVHGRLRVATERTVFAMPETGIGFFPDVGGTWFLPRLPGRVGVWLGLTGARLKGREAVLAGLCDAHLLAAEVDRLLIALAEGAHPDALIDAGVPLESAHGETIEAQEAIDGAFRGESVEAVLENLDAAGDWGRETAETIRAKSPTAVRVAFRQIREGAKLGFEDCMRLEYRLARFMIGRPDFYEGVRAAIIDKDRAPEWQPPTLDQADEASVAPAFEPLGDEELAL